MTVDYLFLIELSYFADSSRRVGYAESEFITILSRSLKALGKFLKHKKIERNSEINLNR